jgi:transposase, IS605 orfB family
MKAYKTEIKPNKKQIELLHQTFGNTRYIYNQFISFNFDRLKNNEPIMSGNDYSKMINNDPNRPDWLIKSPSKAIKQAIKNGEKAIWDYLNGKKGKPNFKKKTKDNSFYLIGTIKIERHRIFLPVLKWVRLKEFGYIPNNVKSVTVSMKNGRYYVSCLTHEVKDERIITSNEGIGIDFGLKNQFITKNEIIPSINKSKRVRKLEKKLKQKQRALSRKYENNMINKVYYKTGKKKGHLKDYEWERPLHECKNLNKNQRVVNKLYERIARIRTDYNQKALQSILKQKPSFIVIEDLNIKGLMKNKHLSKAISNAQWYMSRLFLTNQCEKLGIELRLAPRFYPSSKLCSCCGYKNTELKLKERTWTCPKCSVVHDRDKNASLNLEQCQNYTVLTTV